MAVNYLCFMLIAVLLRITIIQAALQTVDGKIKITVGTTSACADTVRFISNQLAETYDEYKEFLEIEFVPWGKTVINENGEMVCQFGPNDCWANRVHRCALDLLKNNQDAQMFYMKCEFSPPHPAFLQGSYLCAQAAGLDLVNLDYCVNTSGDALDEAARVAAEEPMEALWFVPSIHFNDVVDDALHNEGFLRLKSLICFALAEDSTTGITNCQI